jgi:hypothetical protein
VRRLALPLVLLLAASTASAATIRGSKHGELLVGTPNPDRIVAGAGNDFVQAAFGGVDRVDCGAGIDVVTADAVDTLASNCEIVSRRISVDPYANTDSQHETAVEPDSFAWGSTVVAAYQLGRRAQGAAANIGMAVSHDAGRTWRRSLLSGVTVNVGGGDAGASDPSVTYDAVHGQWLVSVLSVRPGDSHIVVARSTDGVHWTNGVAAEGPVLDKEWITCDNNAGSPFRGRCYLAYSDDDKNITASQSSDDGGVTWSAEVSAGSTLIGTQPVVQPNGTLVVLAGDYRDARALSGSIVALRSTDGGATFTRFTVSDLQAASDDPMRAISLPSVAADSAGTIYASWGDCRFRPDCTANDIVVSTSSDGMTWSTPTRVPVGTPTSPINAFIPGLAADPSSPGGLALVYAYFDARGQLGVAVQQSQDGGRSWTAPQRLDAQPMSTSWLPRAEGGRMLGDYFSTSYAGGRVVPVFALATSPLNGRFREAIFAASLRSVG